METPLVSVCMTTYNHAPYLRQAVESVLSQQTSFDFELVLGEDCSTDLTAEICREYAAKYPGRVRLVTGARNVGWRANYRRTFDACRGKYVAYCDGDDWWTDPCKLQMQADLMESDPGCGMCYTGADEYWQAEGTLKPDPDRHYTDFEQMLLGISVPNCTALARRELIAAYYAEIRPEEHPEWLTDDWPMWLWFACRSRIRFIDRVTAVHRRMVGSVSHGDSYRGTPCEPRFGDGDQSLVRRTLHGFAQPLPHSAPPSCGRALAALVEGGRSRRIPRALVGRSAADAAARLLPGGGYFSGEENSFST